MLAPNHAFGPIRQIRFLGSLVFLLGGGTIAACSTDAWLDESNPSGNHFFEARFAREVRSFWYISASQIDTAAQLLKTQAIVSISAERAASLIGAFRTSPRASPCILFAPSTLPTRLLFAFIKQARG